MKYVLIESNTTGTGGLAVERLIEKGHDVIFMTRDAARYSFLAKHNQGLKVVHVDTNDIDAVSAELKRLLPVDALLTFSTFYVGTVAELAHRNGLRFLNPHTAKICHQKPLLRQALRESDLHSPPFEVVESVEGAGKVSEYWSYPCIVKPAADSGSNGVLLVLSREELVTHSGRLLTATSNERGQTQLRQVLVEGLLEGPEFSVETITLSPGCTLVLGVTAKHLSDPPYFVEIGHDFPASISEEVRVALEKATVTALDLVGYDFGPAHTEVRMTQSGPAIVEINPRLAGGMIPELVRLATGVDLLSVVLDAAAGKSVSIAPIHCGIALIRFIVAPRNGVLKSIPQHPLREGMPLVQNVTFEKAAGSIVRLPKCASDRLGFVIGSGQERGAVLSQVEAAATLIEHELESLINEM